MTAQQIHDALTLLPLDLVAEADSRRSFSPKGIPWKRYLSLAACLVLLVSSGWFCLMLFHAGGTKQNAAAEVPMLQADRESANDVETPAEAAPMAPEEGLGSTTTDSTNAHVHSPAQEDASSTDRERGDWCGNMTATIYLDETSHSISGTAAITLTDLLATLPYSQEALCRCMAEFTVDTEVAAGYEINLTKHFVRLNGTQAPLTESQVQTIQSILQELES